MGKPDGACPYCGTLNSYNQATCSKCAEPLPWAGWVTARGLPPDAVGAQRGSGATPGGTAIGDGGIALPAGVLPRLGLVVLILIAAYFAIVRLAPGLHQVAPQAGNGTIVEQFKKSTGAVGEDHGTLPAK